MDDDVSKAERRRRKMSAATTLDLSATEVQPEAESAKVAPMAGETTANDARPEEPAASSLLGGTATGPEAVAEPPRQTPPREFIDEPASRDEPGLMPLVAAALIGGVCGGAIVLATALAGILPGYRSGEENVGTRLVALEQEQASLRQTVDGAVGRLAVAEQSAKAASDAASNAVNLAAETKGSGSAGDAGTSERIAKLEAAAAELREALTPITDRASAAASTAEKSASGLAETERRMAELEKSAGGADQADKRAVYVVALGQLSEAIRQGRPFETDLQTAMALRGDPGKLASLSPFAQKGVPTVDALATAFEAAAPAIRTALAPPVEGRSPVDGTLDRLWGSLAGVVSVTREGEAVPAAPEDPLGAIAAALRRGDVPAAIAQFSSLPAPAQQAGAAWLTQARSTLDATELVRAETSSALQTLSKE